MEKVKSSSTKSGKESRDEKQKDSKLEEQVLKSFPSSFSVDEKFSQLLKRFIEVEKENKRLNAVMRQDEKRYEVLLKEKDNLQKEFHKGTLMRQKVEEVCREQQKFIKSVKNENLTKIREEEERRKENQIKFQHSINEINQTLNKNNEENQKLRQDNIEMTKKLKQLAEQCQEREKQLDKINEDVKVESQLHEAKLTKLKIEAAIDKEQLLKEKKAALDELLNCKKTIQELKTREDLLKEQLNLYSSTYDDFQTSLQKSKGMFAAYKAEIEKMQKNTEELGKESLEWQRKWEESNAMLIELSNEKQLNDDYVTKMKKQIQQLQKLLRTLQAERIILHQILKDNNIERPSIPVLPPEPELLSAPLPPPNTDKLELMVKNCAELKQTLAKLQGQINEIKGMQGAESSESKDRKKSKNRKSKQKSRTCPIRDRKQSIGDQEKILEINTKSIENSIIDTFPSLKNTSLEDDYKTEELQEIKSDQENVSESRENQNEILSETTVDTNVDDKLPETYTVNSVDTSPDQTSNVNNFIDNNLLVNEELNPTSSG